MNETTGDEDIDVAELIIFNPVGIGWKAILSYCPEDLPKPTLPEDVIRLHWVMGTSPDCHLFLPSDPYISKEHIILSYFLDNGEMIIEELASANGTGVVLAPGLGKMRLGPGGRVTIREGSKIFIGRTTITINKIHGPTNGLGKQ